MSAGELESEKAGQESLELYIPLCLALCHTLPCCSSVSHFVIFHTM
jgi:hypothetical protein